MVVRLDKTEPLLDAPFDVSSALSHVTKQSSRQAKVGFSIREDLKIEHVQDPLVMQGKDALQDQHMRRINRGRLIKPSVLLKGIDWNVCFFTSENVSDGRGDGGLIETYPALMSLSLSTRTSKSMASGASKSYSLRKAAALCSGVRGL